MDTWQKLRQAYITSEESLGKLAEDFELDVRSAYRRCSSEGWVKARKEHRQQSGGDPLLRAADALLSRVRQVLEGPEELDVKSMRDLAAVLKEIRGMQGKEEEEGISVSLRQEVMDYSG